jgi:hypothetical protein
MVLQRIEGISDYVDEYLEGIKNAIEAGKSTDELYIAYAIYCQRENIKHQRNKSWFIRLLMKDLKERYKLDVDIRTKKESGRLVKCFYFRGRGDDVERYDDININDEKLDF